MTLIARVDGSSVASVLAVRATSDPEGPFLLFRGRTLTYGEVDSSAEALAASLHNLGIEADDRVALVLPACPEFVISMFAAAKLGASIVPLNPRLTTPDLQYRLRHSEAACAITIEEHHGIKYVELFEDLLNNRVTLKRNFYRMNRRTVERFATGRPFAFIVPGDQHDPAAGAKLVRLLQAEAIEVHRATASFDADGRRFEADDYVVRLDQAFGRWAKDILEPQDYPDIRWPNANASSSPVLSSVPRTTIETFSSVI